MPIDQEAQECADRIAGLDDQTPDGIYRYTSDYRVRALAAAAASNAATGGGGHTLLHDETLAAPGTFDVTGIDQTYSDLLIRLVARGTGSTPIDTAHMTLNGDTAAHYAEQSVAKEGGGSDVGIGAAGGTLTWAQFRMPNAANPAGLFGVSDLLIYGYSRTGLFKNMIGVNSFMADPTVATNNTAAAQACLWASTDAVTSLHIEGFRAANLAAGSWLRLYGVT